VAVDPLGDIHVADQNANAARKMSLFGTNWVVSSIPGVVAAGAVAADSNGDVYVIEFFNSTVRRLRRVETNWVVCALGGLARSYGTTDGTNSAARFDHPISIATDGGGGLFVADTFNHTIRQGTPVPLLQQLDFSNGTLTFAWSTIPGISYQLQCSTNTTIPQG
jgi:hypothetical protein